MKAFLNHDFKVSVSVVSIEASFAYEGLALENLWVGPLDGIEGISSVLSEAANSENKIDCVVDATHPFATVISRDLQEACKAFEKRLIRFERPLTDSVGSTFLGSLEELSNKAEQGQRILLAIGSRHLLRAVSSAKEAGAIIFARVLPSPINIRTALIAGLPESHLAVARPSKNFSSAALETALCRRWDVDVVVCRQSGGVVEHLWREVSRQLGIDLWLVERPGQPLGIEVVNTLKEVLAKIKTI